MAKILNVYKAQELVGKLIQNNHGEMQFSYSESWLSNPDAFVISYSLPLRKKTYGCKACRAFFSGILPEESNRRTIARILGISPNNDFSMLEKVGGECAGALTLLSENDSPPEDKSYYCELSEESLEQALQILPKRALLAGEEDIRLSLAGVQDKIAVHVQGNKISLPLGGSASTHIIKPEFSGYEGVLQNEAFCLELAKKVGMKVANAEIRRAGSISYLLIERYDRVIDQHSVVKRLHQEDFCQALNVVSEKKYQNEGGPSLKQTFDLIREYSEAPVVDLPKLLDAVIFNYLIGNCDAHAKNFSVIINPTVRLSPLYDLVCTTCNKELSRKMAMKLGGEYKIDLVTLKHFDKFSGEVGLSQKAVRNRIGEMCEKVRLAIVSRSLNDQVVEAIVVEVETRCKKLESQLSIIQ